MRFQKQGVFVNGTLTGVKNLCFARRLKCSACSLTCTTSVSSSVTPVAKGATSPVGSDSVRDFVRDTEVAQFHHRGYRVVRVHRWVIPADEDWFSC
jgi:hypothetical protein